MIAGKKADNRCKVGSGGDACDDKSEFRITVQRCCVDSRLFGELVEAIASYFLESTYPLQGIPGIINGRREWILWCKPVVHVDNYNVECHDERSAEICRRIQIAQYESTSMVIDHQWTSSCWRLDWAVNANWDGGTISDWDIVVFLDDTF
jgi:hypothetical protein